MQTNLFKTDAAIRAACEMGYPGERCRLLPERE